MNTLLCQKTRLLLLENVTHLSNGKQIPSKNVTSLNQMMPFFYDMDGSPCDAHRNQEDLPLETRRPLPLDYLNSDFGCLREKEWGSTERGRERERKK
jgi:hypothetical protein